MTESTPKHSLSKLLSPKKIAGDALAILAFIIISLVYFYPVISEGKILSQHDSVAGIGGGEEARDYMERTGERTRWTNAIFGGMPTYQLSPSYDSTDNLRFVEKAYHLFLPNYVWLMFIMMLGFYILLRAFKVSPLLSWLGAIMWGFSSYFFIIIAAGHIWKFITLAYIPPTIAGMVLAYRGKYLWGGLLTALFVALQILSNHVQMTYYFLFVILFMVIAYFVIALQKKTLPQFFKASGVLALAAIIGISINLSSLYHTYEYSKETMRGKSELVKPDTGNQTKSGLERNYIVHWSYGIGETLSLMIPNVKGGASVSMAKNEKAMEKANPQFSWLYSQIGQYWGDQPFTSGPVYAGAFVVMLFILGLFIIKSPIKWALLAATILSILLSWGQNFMGFTDFFLDYFPMYDKFRAVSSILVIAEFTIPLLAILTLKAIIDNPQILKENLKAIYISFGLTSGIALICAIIPRLLFSSYIPLVEMNALRSIDLPAEQVTAIISNLEEMRISIFTADAWRSFFIILVGTFMLLAYNSKKLKAQWLIVGLILLCLGDMWNINKRYLKDEDFVSPNQREALFQKTAVDEYILQDQTLDYRVLNLSTSTFQENNTSYWHKSVGGYHAAKLRRYQELIDYHIENEIKVIKQENKQAQRDTISRNPPSFPVLNMLNTRYFILPDDQGSVTPLLNPYANGNAWFVENIFYVDNANEEIAALDKVSLTQTAIVDTKFKTTLGTVEAATTDSLSKITLTSYEPNHLVYQSVNSRPGTGVFSEIYYPGWQAYIDGKPVEHGRANYILRILNIPAGEHTVEFKFDPKSIHITEMIAYAGIGVLLIGFILLLVKLRKKFVKS